MENVTQNQPSSLTSGVGATDVAANEIHVVWTSSTWKEEKTKC